MMEIHPKPTEILKKLQRIYTFMFLSSLTMAGVGSLAVSRLGDTYQFSSSIATLASYAAIAMVLILIPLSQALPQRRIALLNRENPLEILLAHYSKAIILRFAMIQIAVLFATSGFIITKNTDMLLLVAIGLLFLSLNRPSRFKVAKDLNLSTDDEARLSKA